VRTFLILALLFSFPAFADDVALPRVFPQQYTKEQAKRIVPLHFFSPEKNPGVKQAFLVSMYADTVNSGKFNVHAVTTYYHDGYLDRVELAILPFKGEGNRLRLAIRVETEGDTPHERDFVHHASMAAYLMKHHRELVVSTTRVGYDGKPLAAPMLPLCEEIFYLEPKGYDPSATIDSLTQKSAMRSRAPDAIH
jgi:hypothetical protein